MQWCVGEMLGLLLEAPREFQLEHCAEGKECSGWFLARVLLCQGLNPELAQEQPVTPSANYLSGRKSH